MKIFKLLLILFCFLQKLSAQTPLKDQKDIIDVLRHVRKIQTPRKTDSTAFKAGAKVFTALPLIGYAPQSSFLAQVTSNLVFKQPNANLSSVNLLATVTLKKQLILHNASTFFTKNNNYFFSTEWRLMNYPQPTYGLGMFTDKDKPIDMNYNYLRLYQNFMKRINKNSYIGLGYYFDYHWDIESTANEQEINQISGYTNGILGNSTSSGPAISYLFDNRENSLNSQKGLFVNIVFRQNLTALGSNSNYKSILVDARKYINLPQNSSNVLAFWSYNVITTGNPPFLDLPSTGWDANANSGRGFIQGRFRGKDLFYFESEYRFNISKNHLLGGVAFANAQTVPEPSTLKFEKIMPSVGLGLRIKANKFTNANITVDYGIGADGSNNIYFNFGEVF